MSYDGDVGHSLGKKHKGSINIKFNDETFNHSFLWDVEQTNHLMNSIFFLIQMYLLLIHTGFTFNLEATWIIDAEISLNILLFYNLSIIDNHCRFSVATTK